MEFLPPRVRDPETFEVLVQCLSVAASVQETNTLRRRFFAPEFSWQALAELAAEHNVLVPLIFCLKRRGLMLPLPRQLPDHATLAHPTRQFDKAYAQNLERREDLRSQLRDIATSLNARGIVPVALKGARYLLDDAPDWVGARTMRDLDLLVRPDQSEAARSVLADSGYREVDVDAQSDHQLKAMRLPGRHGSVEIHHRALVQYARPMLPDDEVWSRSQEGRIDAARLRFLPQPWFLVFGMLHHQVGDQGHARRVLALKGLWEFAMEGARLSRAEWDIVLDHANAYGAGPALAEWIVLAGRLFDMPKPDSAQISERQRGRAAATLAWAGRPTWMRQALFSLHTLAFAFSRERLAWRYGRNPEGAMLDVRLRHGLYLTARHAGRQARRLLASRTDRDASE